MITKTQAEQSLALVVKRFKAYTEDGSNMPTLVEGWTDSGNDWTIVWEEGPYEWAYRVTSGGVDEEAASLGAEFGFTPQAEDPATFPKGVYAEPYFSFALCLYED